MTAIALRSALVLTLVGAFVWTADALVTTDEERLEAVADALAGRLEDTRLDHALTHVDLAREPVELVARDGVDLYRAGDEASLEDDVRRAVAPYLGETARMLQRQVEADGDEGLVAVRLLVAGETADVQLRLRRHGDTWLVRRVRVL